MKKLSIGFTLLISMSSFASGSIDFPQSFDKDRHSGTYQCGGRETVKLNLIDETMTLKSGSNGHGEYLILSGKVFGIVEYNKDDTVKTISFQHSIRSTNIQFDKNKNNTWEVRTSSQRELCEKIN